MDKIIVEPNSATKPIRLTSLSHGAGCACKLSAKELSSVLQNLPLVSDPRALIDASTKDDAAVYQIDDDRAIVATLDFFAPIVDDPYSFGAIATANAFSDIYAMAARPLFGLSIVAWPRDPEILPLLNKVMQGGMDVANAAGAFILGGHSIDDAEPKFGVVAIGEVNITDMKSNANSKLGDVLILTKPIGTGILTTALKRDLITESQLQPAVESMSMLNASAAEVVRQYGDDVHALTDITGFGLLGHLSNMLHACGHSAKIIVKNIPTFPDVMKLIDSNVIPGGTRRNHEAACDYTNWGSAISKSDQYLLTDAQTSGGLLIAVNQEQATSFVADLAKAGTLAQAVIGEIVPRAQSLIEIE